MSIQLPHPPTFQQAERTLTRWTRDARVRSALMALYAAQRRAFERQYPAAAVTVPGEYPAATETTRAMPVSQLKAFMFTAAYNAAPRGEPSGFSQRDHHDLLALVTRAEQASRNVPAAQGTRQLPLLVA